MERELFFIEDYMSRYMFPLSGTKTFVVFVSITTTKKNILSGVELRFVTLVWSKIRKTCTSKGFEREIVWYFSKEFLNGRNILKN